MLGLDKISINSGLKSFFAKASACLKLAAGSRITMQNIGGIGGNTVMVGEQNQCEKHHWW